MSHVQNDTRKIVKPKDTTEGIARMVVLDLRSFDIVEGVGFNELFILVTNPFPTLSGIPINSNISKFSGTRPDPEEISCSLSDPIFRVLAHLYVIFIFFTKSNYVCTAF